MEQKELNIAEILKDKPEDTKLWSDTFGEVNLKDVTIDKRNGYPIFLATKVYDETLYLDAFGRYYKNTDSLLPCIVPSKEMRDWKKFVWKKGDVLSNDAGNITCMFAGWHDDEYNTFNAKFLRNSDGSKWQDETWLYTRNFFKSPDSEASINMIEEQYGGKLNLETLEIEKQPEFKDGDILTYDGFIFIFKNKEEGVVYPHATCDIGNKDNVVCEYKPFASNRHIKYFKYATEEEKQQLFDALAKKGKQWDAEKKQIVDMQFKPFDKVLVRDESTGCWRSAFFVCFDKDSGIKGNYIALTLIGGHSNHFHQCIPYNEETKHLLDTTDDWEGGEK